MERSSVASPSWTWRPWRDDQLTLSWLGHATVLLNFFGVWILTDPALRARVGVRVGPFTFGPKRYVAPALRTSELPPLDFILLTHAHMDHLDVGTLRRLRRDVTVVTAAATADLLTPMRFRDVVETRWGESRQFDTPRGGLSVEAFRVQHWGARMRSDVHRGYNGYVLDVRAGASASPATRRERASPRWAGSRRM